MLGVNFSFDSTPSGHEVEIGMPDYFTAVVTRWASEGRPGLTPRHISALGTEKGALAEVAQSYLMYLLFGSRMSRPDIMHTILSIARQSARWSRIVDMRLTAWMTYVMSIVNMIQCGFIARDSMKTAVAALYVDADLAGNPFSSRSTSGGFICLEDQPSGSLLMVDFWGRRQSATARSTCGAELSSLATGIESYVIPTVELMESALDQIARVVIHEDNQAAISEAKRGYSPALRSPQKHHRVMIWVLSELVCRPDFELVHISASCQRADGLTKGLNAQSQQLACQVMDMRTPAQTAVRAKL